MKKVLAMLVATSMLLSMSVCFAGGTEEEELAEVTAVEETVVEEATEEAAEEVTEAVGDGESAAVEEIAAPVIEREEGEIVVTIDGVQVKFPDQKPVIIEDRTLVPLRAIFEALGAVVSWDNDTNTAMAVKGETYVFVQIDNEKLIKNDETVILDVPAKLINDRTMVPVRAIAEAFECTVDWVEENLEVVVKTAVEEETVVEETVVEETVVEETIVEETIIEETIVEEIIEEEIIEEEIIEEEIIEEEIIEDGE